MGTSWSVRFVAPAGITEQAIEAEVLGRLDAINAEMSHWRPDSRISDYNRSTGGSRISLSPDFARVMETAIAIARDSDGSFDPTIGQVIAYRGFGPDPAERRMDETSISTALAAAGWWRLRLEEGALLQPGGLRLDLSGGAKGYAVDAVADLLGHQGIGNALVEIGGELVGRGVKPDGEPWWVDLEDPPGIALAPLRIALHGLAVATSGDYRRGPHTIDPRNGKPVSNGVRQVSVIDRSAMRADAWATALTVLGAEEGSRIAAQHGLAARIVGTSEWLSPALRQMLDDWPQGPCPPLGSTP